MGVCACVCPDMHAHVFLRVWSVLLYYCLSYTLEQCLSMTLELSPLATLAGRRALGSTCLDHAPVVSVGIGDSNTGPHACVVSNLLTGPSL